MGNLCFFDELSGRKTKRAPIVAERNTWNHFVVEGNSGLYTTLEYYRTLEPLVVQMFLAFSSKNRIGGFFRQGKQGVYEKE